KSLVALSSVSLVQRKDQLNTDGISKVGNFYQFPPKPHHQNSKNRPLFQNPKSVMTTYTGPGEEGTKPIHPAVEAPLETIMSALHEEGERIQDDSLKQAVVGSAFRPPTKVEGKLYLNSLIKTIKKNPKIFQGLTFPPSLE